MGLSKKSVAREDRLATPMLDYVRYGSDLDTDWGNFWDLWVNLQRFAREHPAYHVLSADDPTTGRIGFAAFLDGEEEDYHRWTITLSNLARSLQMSYDIEGREDIERVLRTGTAQGRRTLVANMVAAARAPAIIERVLGTERGRQRLSEAISAAREEYLDRVTQEELLENLPRRMVVLCMDCANREGRVGHQEELTRGGHAHPNCDHCGRLFVGVEQAFHYWEYLEPSSAESSG